MVLGQRRRADHLAEGLELPVGADGQNEPALASLEVRVRRDARMLVAHALWDDTGDRVARGLVDERRQ